MAQCFSREKQWYACDQCSRVELGPPFISLTVRCTPTSSWDVRSYRCLVDWLIGVAARTAATFGS